jgi:hypothetical protein
MYVSTSKHIYNVTLELMAMVLAESEEEARKIAMRDAFRDALCNSDQYDCNASIASSIPGNYSHQDLVYHDGKGDITVDQAIAMDEESELNR